MPDRREEVSISIDGRRWTDWESVEIVRTLDAIDTAGFVAPWEPSRADMRETFAPFQYRRLDLRVGDEGIFSGTMMRADPTTKPDNRKINASGYSFPGVLWDATPRPEAYPLELNGLKIGEIARVLMAPYEIEPIIDPGDEGAAFRRTSISVDEKIGGYLTKLAKERGLLISNTEIGNLRFFKSTPGEPVARFLEGVPPLEDVEVSIDPQQYWSEITGISKTRTGRVGASYTVRNDRVQSALRPAVFVLEDTDDSDIPAAATARLGRMFGNAFKPSIQLPTWRTSAGALWAPDDVITLGAPGAMIYTETDFTVRNVTLSQNASKTWATLELVLPGVFSGEVPEAMPWD